MGLIKEIITRSANNVKRTFIDEEEPKVRKQIMPESKYEDMLSVIEIEGDASSNEIIIIDDDN